MKPTIDQETLLQHVDGVRRLARSLVRDPSEADDVAQDTLVAALQSKTGRRAGPKAWLAGVTRNVARHTARSAGRRRKHETAAASAAVGLEPPTEELVIRAAEQSRLLDEFVVVPLVLVKEAVIQASIHGLGSKAAYRIPGFIGSLRSVSK